MKRAAAQVTRRARQAFAQLAGREQNWVPVYLDCRAFNRLVDAYPANADVFDRLELLDKDMRYQENRSYFVVTTPEGKIIGAATVMASMWYPGALALSQISVDPAYKDKGHGTRLIRAIFEHVVAQSMPLYVSGFEPEGWAYMAPTMARLHADYPLLRIAYGSYGQESITGERPYQLTGSAFDMRPVFVSSEVQVKRRAQQSIRPTAK